MIPPGRAAEIRATASQQDAERRFWGGGDRGAARPQRDVRAEDRPQARTRFRGFDDKILSMYARGMTTREIQGHLQEIYGVEVSPSLISEVTDAVLEEVKAWQTRPLEPLYPILFLDALW